MARKRKSQALRLTEKQIEELKSNPVVKSVKTNRVVFTYEFRLELYKAWELSPSNATLRNLIQSKGISPRMLGEKLIPRINSTFKQKGIPSRGKHSIPVYNPEYNTSAAANCEQLLNTGKFIKNKNGISFASDFIDELYHLYPDQTVEEGLKIAGIDPQLVGYQRIYTLQRRFEKYGESCDGTLKGERTEYSADIIDALSGNPFVKRITAKQLVFRDCFFNEVYPVRHLHIDEILSLCDVNPSILSISRRNNLKNKLIKWSCSGEELQGTTEFRIRFYRRLSGKLSETVMDGFKKLSDMIPPSGTLRKKAFIRGISEIPEDPQGYFTRSRILKLCGVSRSSYYSILKDEKYGSGEGEKEKQDMEDARAVRTTLEYKGIRKGSRQIYMQMPGLTGKHMSLKKIRRLMKKYGMKTDIRKPVKSGKAMKEMIERQRKPNLLDRRFFLHRPGELALTDVTYIKHDNGHTSYASAILDPVTGRLRCFNVSDTNDLTLTLDSVRTIRREEVPEGATFHSDQGMLYMNESFQELVAGLGYTQSMSRRGNCWDNAPQESFFGHFKDECSFSDAENAAELVPILEMYKDYWNNERKQWGRKRMTPAEYEQYMNSMTDDEYAAYLKKEEERYNLMKKKSAEKARMRAVSLGVEDRCYGKEQTADQR